MVRRILQFIGDTLFGARRCGELRELVKFWEDSAENETKRRRVAWAERNEFEKDLRGVRRAHEAALERWGIEGRFIDMPCGDRAPAICFAGAPEISVSRPSVPASWAVRRQEIFELRIRLAVDEDSFPETVDTPTFVAMMLRKRLGVDELAHLVSKHVGEK